MNEEVSYTEEDWKKLFREKKKLMFCDKIAFY